MSDSAKSPFQHLIGLLAVVIAVAVIVWAWNDGLGLLNGTLFSELRYFVFAGFVVAFLTFLSKVVEWVFHAAKF